MPVLGVDFATPHSIRWAWDASAIDPSATGYALWYGTSGAEVAARTGQATRWDSTDDPSLGDIVTPVGSDQVGRTTVTDLVPETSYVAELDLLMPGGPAVLVARGTATTPAVPANAVVLFDETLSDCCQSPPLNGCCDGWTLFPSGNCCQCVGSSLSNHAHQGSYSLMILPSTDPNDGGWTNGDMIGLAKSVDLPSAALTDSTYLELFVEIGSGPDAVPPAISWVEVSLNVGAPAVWYGYRSSKGHVSLPSRASWNRIQVPLRLFRSYDSDAPLTVVGLGGTVGVFRLGAGFPSDWTVYVDDVSIRY